MKKWMIIVIVIIYTSLIGLLFYFNLDSKNAQNKLKDKVNTLEEILNTYYETEYDREELGKLFLFPGENTIDFDDTNLFGEAFIYSDGVVEIALYDGKHCAYKKGGEVVVTISEITDCVVNRG